MRYKFAPRFAIKVESTGIPGIISDLPPLAPRDVNELPYLPMQPKHFQGFTLVELLVVLAILGLLAGLVGPQVMKHFAGAKSDTAKLQIADLGAALDLFYLDNGRYPSGSEGLGALVKEPSGLPQWNGPYLKKTAIPKDPWGNDYQYQSPGQHGTYDLSSYGADNAPGGEKDNRDQVSWE